MFENMCRSGKFGGRFNSEETQFVVEGRGTAFAFVEKPEPQIDVGLAAMKLLCPR